MAAPLAFAHFEVLTRSDGSPFVLGQGAMGVTYKALDKNLLSLAVIKVPATELQAEPAARQRFLQEAQMMARLRHPHVANVFFFGDSRAGAFYAMEFCEGPTLQDYVAEHGPMNWRDTAALALQAAAALQALEAHELVHRDLKPSNIILSRDEAGHAHLKLIDFGVAREGLPSDLGGLTKSGFIGTPAYASPEQLLESAHVDARSDLYALGAVLWFCLTGKPPFEGTQFEVMFHHINTEPDWEKLGSVPEAGLAIMKRLLAKFVEERYASSAILLSELQKVLGSGGASSIQLRPTAKSGQADLGGYEPIVEAGSDAFGKLWRARDILTGRTVALRLLSPEFSSKSALVLRAQRLTAFVRPLKHPNWQRVWHFEQSGAECRLATEWVNGPTLLGLLKARKVIPLAEALELLEQLADAMDFAAAQGLTAVETAPERIPFRVAGWAEMTPEQQSQLLRQPMAQWPKWGARICPLRLSMSAQDYVLPTDTAAGQTISRITADFVQVCYRLLTGQGGFVPSPVLKPEGNAFFEKHYSSAGTGVSCQQLLRQLCLAEGVMPPPDSSEDPAAAVTTRAAAPPTTRASSPGTTTWSGTRSPSPATTRGAKPTVASTMPLAGVKALGPAVASRLQELEQRRAELDAEAERLKMEERLQAERDWLARERDELEKARREVAAHEAANASRMAAEEALIAEQRQAVEQQQMLLESKRREQQRLEQEIQLRAQLEVQKLQEEAKSRESQWQHHRVTVEEALHRREAEFRAREQESLARLEALKAEASALEESVGRDAITLRNTELVTNRRNQEEKDVGGLARDAIAAEERRIGQIREDLDVRLGQWRQVQRRRVITLVIATVVGVALAALAAFYVKGRIVNIDTLPGHEKWTAALQERERAKAEKRWSDLLGWCAVTDQVLRAEPRFAETFRKHQTELAGDAAAAVEALLHQEKNLPDPTSDAGRKLLLNLESLKDNWNLPAARLLLIARLRMPEATARGAAPEALEAYLNAVHADPVFVPVLARDLDATLRRLREQLRSGKLDSGEGLQKPLREVVKVQPQQDKSDAGRFLAEVRCDQARRSGKPEEGLRVLLEGAERNPAWTNDLRAQAADLVAQLTKLSPPSLLPLSLDLRRAGHTWGLADAYMALANLEPDEDSRFSDYKQADSLGSMTARAKMGRMLLVTGDAQKNPALVQQGAAKLREAVAAGDSEAMVLLGEALYAGRGLPEDAAEALKLARQAESKGHPEAFFLAAKAQLRLAEISLEPRAFAEAAEALQVAAEKNLPGAAYFLYFANWNNTVKNPEKAAKALEQGSIARDPNCLWHLGEWLVIGQAPLVKDTTRGRQLIKEAASLGQPSAKEWLQAHP